jgi:hypothetical protein
VPAGAERLHLLARFHGCGKRSGTGMRTIFRRKDCKNAVTDQLEHVATLRVDRRDHDVGIIVQQRNDLLRRSIRDPGKATQVAEPDGGVDTLSHAA